jgi:prepilin-type N-terminal cleavage/methylation domain-containing protein
VIGDEVIMSIPQRPPASSVGFTLIEVIIVIAILAVVAGAMAPLAIRTIDSSRQDLTLKRQQHIYQAIMGDPSASGSGFLSDIGRLPGVDLSELATVGSLPLYSIQTCGVGMGWRGPYLLEGVNAAGRPLDGWGTPMDLVNGQIRSAGLDHSMIATADNLVYPPTPITVNNVNGNIVLQVLALDNSTAQPTFVPAGGQATVYFAGNGLMQSVSLTSSSGSYVFPASGASLPQGIHAISVTGDPDGNGNGNGNGNGCGNGNGNANGCGNGNQPSLTNIVKVFLPGGGTSYLTVALR